MAGANIITSHSTHTVNRYIKHAQKTSRPVDLFIEDAPRPANKFTSI
jgi:hypothetical protein